MDIKHGVERGELQLDILKDNDKNDVKDRSQKRLLIRGPFLYTHTCLTLRGDETGEGVLTNFFFLQKVRQVEV